ESQAHESVEEDAEHSAETEPEKKSGQNGGQETTSARSSQPVEIEAGGFRRWLGGDRHRARNLSVEPGPVPAGRTGARLAIGHYHFEGRSRGLVKTVLNRG